jgi:hypothetical protein
MVVPIFKSDIVANYDTSFCPTKDYNKYNILTEEYNYYDVSYSNVMDCKNIDNNYEGCCIIKDNDTNLTCEDVFNSNDHYMGMKYIFPETDISNISFSVCHTEPVREYVEQFGFGPNKIINFFQLLLVAIVSLMITAIIACCYEFWLKYSESIDCFYYKSNCKNIGAPRDGKEGVFSLADYMFPNRLSFYPYQFCNDDNNLTGGGKNTNNSFVSNYAEYNEQGVKCITIEEDKSKKKVFPYNIADYAHENLKPNSLLSMILKAFSFFFLFTVLMTRKVLHSFFSRISKKYNKNVKNNPIVSNIVFLLLGNIGIGIVFILTTLLNATFLNPGFAVIYSFFILNTFNKWFKKSLDKCTDLIPGNLDYKHLYYNIYTSSNFYSMLYCQRPIKIFNNYRINYPNNSNVRAFNHTFWSFIINLLKNFFMIVIILLSLFISLGFGSAGALFACIYMNLSLLFNIFYIPLSNQIEFFDILKEHGNLLTILFCMGIVGSSVVAEFQPATVGVMSGILAIIILIKMIKGFKKYS